MMVRRSLLLGSALAVSALAVAARPASPPAPTLALWATASAAHQKSEGAPPLPSLLFSANGGGTWTARRTDFAPIGTPAMLTTEDGWVAGQSAKGTLYYGNTRDGGSTWTHTTTSGIPALSFLNGRLGWRNMAIPNAAGQTTWRLLATTNGGVTWKRLWSHGLSTDGIATAPFFLTPRIGWTVTADGSGWYVWKTRNGGRSFREQTTELEPGFQPLGVTFTTAKRGWVLAAGTGTGQIGIEVLWTSLNGGATWIQPTALPWNMDVEQIFFTSPQQGFVLAPIVMHRGKTGEVPYGTRIFETTSGGRHWTEIFRSPHQTLTDLVFASPRVGYAIAGHAVLKTVDGGRTWRTEYRSAAWNFQELWSTNAVERLSQ